MTIDDRGRTAGLAVLDRVERLDVPDVAPMVRRAGWRRRTTAGLAVAVVLLAVGLGVVAASRGGSDAAPEPVVTTPAPGHTGWRSIDKADAGLELGSYPNAIDSDEQTAVMVGVSPGDGWWDAAAWWSSDGLAWQPSPVPSTDGMPLDVAIQGQVALATGVVGASDTERGTPFLWRSDDAGRTWAVAGDVEGLDGVALTSVRHFQGYWIGTGTSPGGGNGVWVSRAGHGWQQVIITSPDEPVAVLEVGDGSVRAFTLSQAWTTADPTTWGEPEPFDLPEDVGEVADGFELAIQRAPGPGPGGALVVSDDGGRRWQVDQDFAEQFPGARPTNVARLRVGFLVMGFGAESTPGAWVSTDRRTWNPIPPEVRQPPGGLLAMATEVDGRLVVFGTAPELERFFTYDPPEVDGPLVVPGIPTVDDTAADAPVDELEPADQLTAAPGTMDWFRQQSGIQGFDPSRAAVGVSTLGEILPWLDPLVAQNVPTLDPADFGVATTDEIPVAVGVYRGEPGQFEGPVGPGGSSSEAWDGLMIATTVQPGGPESRSLTSASRFDGIEAVLTPVG